MSENTLLEFPLSILNTLGCLLPRTTTVDRIKLTVHQTVLIYSMVVSILQYFYTQGVIFDIVDNMEATISFIQIYGKFVFLITLKNEILRLLQIQKKFWSADECTETTKTEVARIKNVLRFIQKIFFYGTCFIICCLNIPLGALTHHFGVGIWKIPDHNIWFWFSYVINSLACLIACGIAPTCDILFLGFCYEVVIQFKILGDHLKRVTVNTINSEGELITLEEEVKVYVDHHNFLLRFVNDLRDCYSVVLLMQYLTSATIICSEFYVTFESPSISRKIQHGLTSLALVSQLSFYCIPADLMAHEISRVANEVYKSNWYAKHFMSLKKSTQLMIQRGQQEIRFTAAAGIVDLNCRTLLTVVRGSFSICTLLRNLKH